MKKFSETQPVQTREDDRVPLAPGPFILTGFVLINSKKCPEGVSRINGYDLITRAPLKFWYCGKAIKHQLENMKMSVGMDSGTFNEEIRVMVIEVPGEKGKYLSFADPE